jgi:hypothetical protein
MNQELSQEAPVPADNIQTGGSGQISTVWKQAVSEYFATLELSDKDRDLLTKTKASSDIVASVLETPITHEITRAEKFSQKMFLAAVQSAGTHNDLVCKVEVLKCGNVPKVVSNQIATFLRYASAVDAFLDAMGNTTLISAFVFGAVRFMLDIAVKNLKLLVAIRDKFVDVDMGLRRLDNYLALKEPTGAVRMMAIRMLVNTLRFCGLATKYFSSN